MSMRSLVRRLAAVLVAAVASTSLAGCGSMLPKRHTTTVSTFNSYDQAQSAFDRVQVGVTTAADLRALGFDPATSPNVHVLTYLEVMNTFMPHDGIPLSSLPQSVRDCIAAQTECEGYEVSPDVKHADRTGSWFLDFFDFKRTTKTTGWSADALFVMLDGKVIYKLLSGTPHINETSLSRNPFGPLQDVGSAFNRVIPAVRY